MSVVKREACPSESDTRYMARLHFWASFQSRYQPYDQVLSSGIWARALRCSRLWSWLKQCPGSSDGKVSAYNAGDLGSIPGSGRSPGERNGTPLRYSCLENPMDQGAWWATVHRVAKSWTRLSDFTSLHFTSKQCPRVWQRKKGKTLNP